MSIPPFIRSRWRSGVAGFVLLLAVMAVLERCASRRAADTVSNSAPVPSTVVPGADRTWENQYARQLPPPVKLRPDPEITSERLPNGIRYVMQERSAGSGEVSFRLLVLAGSMHEGENDRGLAHFVEHMAFRKSRHAPQGQVVETMERLGLKTGADTNAYTSSDHTVYKLNLPDADEIALESALTFLRDVSDGLLFEPDEVETERKIVLREMAERSRSVERIRVLPAIFPDVPAAHRPPIGLQSVIEQTTAAQLREFWQRHYVPDRMVLVVAGDLQRTEMKSRIAKHFTSLASRPSPPDPPRGNPLTDEGLTVECVPIPGETSVALRIAVPQPDEMKADHPGLRERELAIDLGLRMLDNRLDRRATTAKLPIASYRIQDHRLMAGIHWLEILNDSVRPEDLPALLRHTISEWRASRAAGFDDWEFAEARQEMKTGYLKRFISRLSQPCAAAADLLVESVVKRRVCESPEDELNRARTNLDALTRRECERITESAWKQSVTRVIVSGAIESGGEARLESLVQATWKISAIPPPAVPPPRPLLIAPFGSRGRLAEDHHRVDPDYREARFVNGVEVRLKPFTGLGGAVIVKVEAGWGQLALPLENPGLGPAAELLAFWYPVAGWEQKEFRAALAESGLDVKFSVLSDRFAWTGYTDRAVLEREIQLLCACLTRPGWRNMSRFWKPDGRTEAWWAGLRGREPLWLRESIFHAAGADPRLDPKMPGFMQSDSRQVNHWLGPILENARIKVTVSGDFSPADAMAALSGTFGALPARMAWDTSCPYPAMPPAATGIKQLKANRAGETGSTLLLPLPCPRNAMEGMRTELLADLFKLRLRKLMRDESGLSYSPSVRAGSYPDPTRIWLRINVPCAARKTEAVSRLSMEMIHDLKSNGWTPDEFRRAAMPFATTEKNERRNPEWWLGALDQLSWLAPDSLMDYQSLLKLEAGTRELARQIKPESALEVRIDSP